MPLVREVVFENAASPAQGEARVVGGELPDGLRGTFLRNGPGAIRVGDDDATLFDAHALIGALHIGPDGLRWRTRPVATPHAEAERAAGRQLYRRPFTNLPSRWSNLGQVRFAALANHDVVPWGDRWLATGVGERAWQAIDPDTLETRGPVRPEGLPAGALVGPMPRRVGDRLIAYAVTPGLSADTITFCELDAALRPLVRIDGRLRRPSASVHDVAASERYLVVAENPSRLDVIGALWGKQPVFSCLRPDRRPGSFVLAPRGGGEIRHVDLPADVANIFHLVNAWDDGDHVVVDAVVAPRPVDFSAAYPDRLRERHGLPLVPFPPSRPARFVLDPARGTLTRTPTDGPAVEQPEMNPAWHGRRHRYAWFPAAAPGGPCATDPAFSVFSDAIVRHDADGADTWWTAPDGWLVSQPAFVARPGATDEDDGWLLTWTLDTARREAGVVVLDARDVTRGPLATITLGAYLPTVSHVAFTA